MLVRTGTGGKANKGIGAIVFIIFSKKSFLIGLFKQFI